MKFTLSEENATKKKKKQTAILPTYTTGDIALNIKHFNELAGTDFDTGNNANAQVSTEASGLTEAERIIKRYYIRPQNIFCSNKEDILKALAKIGDENCSIYSLKNLDDHDDVHLLKPSDIIYYYDNNILYDKNHVQVLDYDLFVKHEEERKKFANVDAISDTTFKKEYDDRLTDKTITEASKLYNSDDYIPQLTNEDIAEILQKAAEILAEKLGKPTSVDDFYNLDIKVSLNNYSEQLWGTIVDYNKVDNNIITVSERGEQLVKTPLDFFFDVIKVPHKSAGYLHLYAIRKAVEAVKKQKTKVFKSDAEAVRDLNIEEIAKIVLDDPDADNLKQ